MAQPIPTRARASSGSVQASELPAGINIPHLSTSATLSTSPPVASPPNQSFFPGTSPISSTLNRNRLLAAAPKVLQPFQEEQIRILVLENISQGAVNQLKEQGFHVDFYTKAWTEDELLEKIGEYHAIGIRSKTKITAKVIKAASKLLVIGCFCIGTNQVDLPAAAAAGICVFNSPYANSRSVAELVISEIIALSRQLIDRGSEMRAGTWNKVSKGCWEVRGKTLGIVGYGHIGSQLSVLAEAMGLTVVYYDVIPIMPLGSARQVDTLEDVLAQADFVTLHVPELEETKNMFSAPQFAAMKQGSYLINNARGTVVDIPSLVDALESGKLAGAAVDVFPREPGANGEGAFGDELNAWSSRLRKCRNTILTPHIGGSTEEAQRMIGIEVASALIRFLNYGSSTGAVQFPEVDLRLISQKDESIRLCHVHQNVPGVLRGVNEILSDYNVEKQFSDSRGDIAYLLADITSVSEEDIARIFELISKTKTNILTRILH